jgi:hypothetical protein
MNDDMAARLRDFAARICSVRGDTNLDNKAVLARAAADEIERLRAERDEARRENCRMAVDLYADESLEDETLEDAAMILAERKGWDCFKDYGK